MHPTRRTHSKSFKAQVIQECAQPGASIASIALNHSLNANLVHKWIRLQAQHCAATCIYSVTRAAGSGELAPNIIEYLRRNPAPARPFFDTFYDDSHRQSLARH
ncbi:transposase [Pseudomonas kitaguniensis]|uniref:transposase n=1 Tax=Pseudomonas kitaguniensis TaxID=2607908 RepID=UPI003D07F59C